MVKRCVKGRNFRRTSVRRCDSDKIDIYRTRAIIARSRFETALEYYLTIHKARILRKKPLEKTFLDIKKWVKSIQTAGYNGARTVDFPTS